MAPPNSSALSQWSSPARDWIAGLFFALTLARWLIPAEASADGETLWIALAWFIAGAGVCCFSSPLAPASGERVRERGQALPAAANVDFANLAVGLLIAGHVISGIVVVITGGDRRAAVNLIWEWLSLGVFWWMARAVLARSDIRRQLVPFLITTALTLSVWGLWQHFVWYPQMAAKWGPVMEQVRNGNRAPELLRQLMEANIPTEQPGLELFYNRLMQSREPFGPFALANTYGGLLAAFIVIGIASALSYASQKRSAAIRIGAWLALIPIAVALYLTNSRTAWVGLLAAMTAACAVWMADKSTSAVIKRWLFPAAIFAGGLAGLAVLGLILRGEHAVPGPLKSLAYRAEYWRGTAQMLQASPWLGIGLGQFRDRYPAFKIPESSEEIADPHNLLLDVWVNGGLISLAGLLGVLALLVMRLCRTQASPTPDPPVLLLLPSTWRLGGVAGFLLALLVPVLTRGLWDHSSDLLAIFGMIWLLSSPRSRLQPECEWSFGANLAALALAIHLLGAGGIGMPAVTQLLLLLLAWGFAPHSTADVAETGDSKSIRRAALGVCALLSAGCVITAWRPVSIAQTELERGDYVWIRGNVESAGGHFRAAAAADSLSPEPWLRLAELEFSRRNRAAAEKAIDEAIRRAPDRASLWRRKGQMLAEHARMSRNQDDWQAAVAAFTEAVRRHPTDAWLLAECAEALFHANSAETAAMARRAIEQDDLNHRRGHTDQYLPAERRVMLERISKAG